MTDATQLPILIIGAGPVGLSLATALTHANIPVQVFEKEAELSPEARASTFHPCTLEMFAEWDVLDIVLERGHQVNFLQFWEREGHELIAQFDYSVIASDTPYPFRLQCPQSILTRVLKPHVEAQDCGQVFMSHELMSFKDCGDHVTATFETPDGQKTVKGRFLCGADGSKSVVREQLGLSFDGMTYEDRFLLIASDIDYSKIYPDLGPVSYIFDPTEWVIILQLPDVTRTVFRVRDDEDSDTIQKTDAVRTRIERFTESAVDFEIKGTSIYSVHQRVTDTFRVGNVVLLGDSAHINNPMGGMGMNSGIHDAHNLADKLIRITAGKPLTLLDQYNAERRKYALDHVQSATKKNYRDMTAQDDTYRQKRNDEFRAIANDKERMREYLLKRSMLDNRI